MAQALSFFIVLLLAISVQGSLDTKIGSGIECESLNDGSCTYAVSSEGKRCVLEKPLIGSGYTCRTSAIVAGSLRDYIETEECISTCGVDRRALGISSDSLVDGAVAQSLCSEDCYDNCPNIVDLYFNLAAAEGVYLPKFCEARRPNGGRREMVELNSVGLERLACAPTASVSKAEGTSDDPAGAPDTSYGDSKMEKSDSPAPGPAGL